MRPRRTAARTWRLVGGPHDGELVEPDRGEEPRFVLRSFRAEGAQLVAAYERSEPGVFAFLWTMPEEEFFAAMERRGIPRSALREGRTA